MINTWSSTEAELAGVDNINAIDLMDKLVVNVTMMLDYSHSFLLTKSKLPYWKLLHWSHWCNISEDVEEPPSVSSAGYLQVPERWSLQ
jgi:hypothetical protein